MPSALPETRLSESDQRIIEQMIGQIIVLSWSMDDQELSTEELILHCLKAHESRIEPGKQQEGNR